MDAFALQPPGSTVATNGEDDPIETKITQALVLSMLVAFKYFRLFSEISLPDPRKIFLIVLVLMAVSFGLEFILMEVHLNSPVVIDRIQLIQLLIHGCIHWSLTLLLWGGSKRLPVQ